MTLPPKPQATKPTLPTESAQTWTDNYGIVYVGDDAEVSVSVAVKLSKHYQSAGIEAGIRFKTKVKGLETAIPAASKKVRDAITAEIKKISDELDHLP